MRKLLIALFLLAPVTLTACNTVKGVGEDISSAGDALSKSADDAKN